MTTPVWVLTKPLVLKGEPGSATWTEVGFAARTISLRWSGTPADASGCELAYRLESKKLSKPAKGSDETGSAKPLRGSRDVTIKYGDGSIEVTSDCATWTLKVVPTGHPGVTISRDTEKTKTKATTAEALNEALGEAETDWWLQTSYRYLGTANPRVVSKKASVDITFELPTWSPPDGADPQLVADWKAAVAGTRRHQTGDAAIAVQAAGRYLASLTKTRFGSVAAMKRYFDKQSDKYLDWANERTQAYDEATYWGATQGALIK